MVESYEFKSGLDFLDYLKENTPRIDSDGTINREDLSKAAKAAYEICLTKNVSFINSVKASKANLLKMSGDDYELTEVMFNGELKMTLEYFFLDAFYSALLLHHELSLPLEDRS